MAMYSQNGLEKSWFTEADETLLLRLSALSRITSIGLDPELKSRFRPWNRAKNPILCQSR